jgi:sRNA-binding protein
MLNSQMLPDLRSNRSLITRYLVWLAVTYPRAFDIKRPAPLKVGIFEDLLADPVRPSWANDQVIKGAMANWVKRCKYRKAVIRRKRRRALDGTRLEPVTMKQVAHAKEASNGKATHRSPPTNR